MEATYIITVAFADGPFEDGDDKARGDLEFSLTHWIEERYGKPDPEFQHNAVTSVAVVRVKEPEVEWRHVIGDDPCTGEVYTDAAGEYGICDNHDRRVKRSKPNAHT